MLQSLHIENYALIQQTDIDFDGGFVAITGETGAGKSILLGALGLLLGQRADAQVLTDKERKCVVEAMFDISDLGLLPLFEQYDADYDDHLVLRREILPSAKSRAFVNDSPASLQFLKELAPRLLDIHSQHQTLTITGKAFQTRLLDSLSESPLINDYQTLFQQYDTLKRQLEQLTAQDAENNKVIEFNRFLYEELKEAKLTADEQQELEEEAHLLEHTGAIKEALGTVAAMCDGNGDSEDSAVARLVAARAAIAHVVDHHSGLRDIHQRLDSSLIELQDILSEVATLDDRLQFSPQRQEQVEDRLDLIYRLQKKHHVDNNAALIDIQNQLDEQLQAAEGLDDRIRQVMEQVDHAYAQMQRAADRLTAARTEAARLLEQQILPILAQMGMSTARLSIEITPTNEYSPLGHDEIVYLFNANQGGSMRPLAEVASGGELSRLTLAIKSIITQRSLLPTVVFDEIDSGISGDISVAVGDIMCNMAGKMQVIAISHLPQIAAKANQHLKVAKALEQDRTISRIRQLSAAERINEIAIMLSSNPPTAAALQTARELIGASSQI